MAWPRSTFLLGLLAAGCTGQSVEGAWRGAFPLEGTRVCEMRFLGDRSMTVACDGSAVVGGGHYRWDGTRLEVGLAVLTYDGHKAASPTPMAFRVQSGGNTLRAAYGGEVYEWKRTMH